MESILKAHHLEKSDIEPEALQMCLSGLYDTEAMERVARISATNKYLNSHGYPGLPLFPVKKSIWESNTNYDDSSSDNNNNKSSESGHCLKPDQEKKDNIKPKKRRLQKTKIEDLSDNKTTTTTTFADGGDVIISTSKAAEEEKSLPLLGRTTTTSTISNVRTHLPPGVLEKMSEEDKQKGAKMGLSTEEYFIIKGNFGKLFDLELDQSSFYHMMKKCKTKIAIKLRSNKEESKKYLQKNLILLARSKLKYFDKSETTSASRSSKTKAKEDASINSEDTESKTGPKNIRRAAEFLKVMMAMHPPLPQLPHFAATT